MGVSEQSRCETLGCSELKDKFSQMSHGRDELMHPISMESSVARKFIESKAEGRISSET